MQVLKDRVTACHLCGLGETCIQKVSGDGNENADLMFVGEAPCETEDKTGLPFQGDCGKLLTKYVMAMGLSRERIYIANTVKCRPPKNRNPEPAETQACIGYLYEQIQKINPKVIVTLGTFATKALIESDQIISKVRGQQFPCKLFPSIVVIPTYHPSFCLRQQSAKITVWQDLKKAMAILGLR